MAQEGESVEPHDASSSSNSSSNIRAHRHLELMSPSMVKRALSESTQSQLHMTESQRRQLTDYSNPSNFDNSQEIDKWAQAYRLLGSFIDCDHGNGEGGGSHDNNDGEGDCTRWTMWAAYYNPNYQGGEYNEYYGNYASSSLDCHQVGTQWQLMGIYKEEMMIFYEQISKHVWGYEDYEYIVAYAGMDYMNDAECSNVGYDSWGNTIYGAVKPIQRGDIMMGLYTDQYCITPANSRLTYGDFASGSSYNGYSYSGSESNYWKYAQEYTLTDFNKVFEQFKSCTLCVDYPSYQDGYFIGDSGTDDDDLINQVREQSRAENTR